MAKKQFKIGECAVGGIIAVEIVNDSIGIKALDWNTKKVVFEDYFGTTSNSERQIDNFLNDLTTSYYSGKILDWIKTKIKL
jgi:hypothetical protein